MVRHPEGRYTYKIIETKQNSRSDTKSKFCLVKLGYDVQFAINSRCRLVLEQIEHFHTFNTCNIQMPSQSSIYTFPHCNKNVVFRRVENFQTKVGLPENLDIDLIKSSKRFQPEKNKHAFISNNFHERNDSIDVNLT